MHIKSNKKDLMLLNLNLRAFMAKMYITESEEEQAIEDKKAVQQCFIVGEKNEAEKYEDREVFIVRFDTADTCTIGQVQPKGCNEHFKEISFNDLMFKFETEELNFISNEMDEDEYFINLYLKTFTSGYLWHIKGLPDFEDKLKTFARTMDMDEYGKSDIFMDNFTWIYAGEEDTHKKLQLEMLIGIMNQLLPYELKLDYFEETDKYYIVDDDRHELGAKYTHLAPIIYEAIMLILDGTK